MNPLPFMWRALTVSASLAAANVALAAPATHFEILIPDPVAFWTATSVLARALDDTEALDTSYAGTVDITSSDPDFSLVAPTTTFSAGTLSFTVAFKHSGQQSLTLTDIATPSITATKSFTVLPGDAVGFEVTAAGPVIAGVPATFSVRASDLFNGTATGYSGTVHMTSSDGQATLPADFALTAGVGSAQATFRTAGNQLLTATDTASPLTGTGTIAVGPGAATHFSVTLPPTVDPGVAFGFDVLARDAFENPNAIYAGTIHFTSSDGAASLPPDGPLTNGQGTFTATLQTAHADTSITATDTQDGSITGSGSVTTTPVELQSFDID